MLNATIDHGLFATTFSRPHLMTADDEQDYIVKFAQNNDRKSLFNEFVGGKLAKFFGLTVLEPMIIHIAQDIIDNSKDLKSRSIKPGEYFATKKMNDIYNIGSQEAQRLEISKIVNHMEVPSFVAFDIFICNNDRNPQNSIVVPLDGAKAKFRYCLIDHGHCFNGPCWNLSGIQDLPYRLSNIPWNKSMIQKQDQFIPIAKKMCSITLKDFSTIVEQTPQEWLPPEDEKRTLTTTLTSRSHEAILKVIITNKTQFPYWVG